MSDRARVNRRTLVGCLLLVALVILIVLRQERVLGFLLVVGLFFVLVIATGPVSRFDIMFSRWVLDRSQKWCKSDNSFVKGLGYLMGNTLELVRPRLILIIMLGLLAGAMVLYDIKVLFLGKHSIFIPLLGTAAVAVAFATVVGVYLTSLVLDEVKRPIDDYREFAEKLHRHLRKCADSVTVYSFLPTLWLPLDIQLARQFEEDVTYLLEKRRKVTFHYLEGNDLEKEIASMAETTPEKIELQPTTYKARKKQATEDIYPKYTPNVTNTWPGAKTAIEFRKDFFQKSRDRWLEILRSPCEPDARAELHPMKKVPFLLVNVDGRILLLGSLDPKGGDYSQLRIEGTVTSNRAMHTVFRKVCEALPKAVPDEGVGT